MYKILFWGLTTIILIYLLIRYAYVVRRIWLILVVNLYMLPVYKYQLWYIKRHGWTPYWYKSLRPEDNGKLFEHPDYWVHKDYKSTRYNNEDGAFPMWSAWQISRGKEDANGKPIK